MPLLTLLLLLNSALADPPSRGEVVTPTTSQPPRLIQQVILEYPEGTTLHGDVTVRVFIAPSGEVMEVEVLEGPEPFHANAISAGRRLRFAPATEAGEPVSSSAVVYFHFAPPIDADDAFHAEDDSTLEIVVHASDPDRSTTQARTTLGETELLRNAGTDLATQVEEIPGVTTAGGTTDNAKPIIRGQQERRLLVLYDGVRHESQKWGPDHATEVDPFSAGTISVIRGAAGARYGSDALGGVILIDPPAMRDTPGFGGKALGTFQLNGLRPYGALRFDVVPAAAPNLSMRVEGNYARGASKRTPDYVLGNTGSEVWNIGAALQYRWKRGDIRIRYQHHQMRAGVFYGVQSGSPSAFEAQLTQKEPTNADLWTTDFAIDRPRQSVQHDLVMTRLTQKVGDWGVFEATYGLQINRRLEFEQVRESVQGPQFDFTLRTHSVDLLLRHTGLTLGTAEVEGGVGLSGSVQENVYAGLALLPNYRSLAMGVSAWERFALGRVDIELGGRYDHNTRTAYLTENDYERHVRRDVLQPEDCDTSETRPACRSAWNTGSVSVGSLLHVVPEHLDIKLDLSSASRFPNIDEQYLSGSAPSLPVYALGRPSLDVETTWGGSTTVALRSAWLDAELSGFAYYVDDYIYFAPELNDAGDVRFDVTVRGAWPRYSYRPVDASFYGTDGIMSFAPRGVLGLDIRGSIVRGVSDGAHLVGTPTDRATISLIGRPPAYKRTVGTRLGVHLDVVAKQNRVAVEADVMPPPDGYALLGLSAETRVELDRATLLLGLNASNIFNARYREYTSLLRYYANEPGTNVTFRVGAEF